MLCRIGRDSGWFEVLDEREEDFHLKEDFFEIIDILTHAYEEWDAPAKAFEKGYERTPFTILCSTVLSFRTKDEETLKAAQRLFERAKTPREMIRLSEEEIAETIYPVGFYRKKAASLIEISRELLENFDEKVPKSYDELISIRGIGPKTAAIVLENAFAEEIVAVDTHVHRILNTLGCVNSETPIETMKRLSENLPPEKRRGLNRILVAFGQSICKPRGAKCGICPVYRYCRAKSGERSDE
jgi:endonuclease-3